MRKVLFILRKSQKVKSYSQGSFGLANSATFVANKLNEEGYEARVVQVDDSNYIDREVATFKPDVVIIEALWVHPRKLAELLSLHRRPRWIVRVHSKAAFLAMEGIAMEWINAYNNLDDIYGNLKVSCNHEAFNNELNHITNLKSVYLPNIYNPMHREFFHYKPDDGVRPINIGCFGAIRPLKNQFQQIIAACMFAKREGRILNIHVNGTRQEQNGDNVLRNIRGLISNTQHTLVEHDWYSHSEFLTCLVPEMDIGMQVSFTESFNIVTADFVHAGVPIVVSNDVEWMPHSTKVDPNDTEAMVRKLHGMLHGKGRFATNYTARVALRNYNTISTEIWKRNI